MKQYPFKQNIVKFEEEFAKDTLKICMLRRELWNKLGLNKNLDRLYLT